MFSLQRNTSLDDLVTRMPAPLVAMALGFGFNAMDQHEIHQGLRFEEYVHGRFHDEEESS